MRSLDTAVLTLDRATPGPFIDDDRAVTAFREANGIAAFLARPDGYAFGSATEEARVNDLVRDLRRALGAGG